LTDAAMRGDSSLKQPECRIRSTELLTRSLREALDKAGLPHRKTLRGSAARGVSRRLRHEFRAGSRPHREEGAPANRRGDQDQLSPHADGDEARGRGARDFSRLPRSRLVRRCAQGHSRRRAGLRHQSGGTGQAHPARVRSRRIQPGLSSSSMRGRPRWAMRSRASFARRATASSASSMSTMPATSSRLSRAPST